MKNSLNTMNTAVLNGVTTHSTHYKIEPSSRRFQIEDAPYIGNIVVSAIKDGAESYDGLIHISDYMLGIHAELLHNFGFDQLNLADFEPSEVTGYMFSEIEDDTKGEVNDIRNMFIDNDNLKSIEYVCLKKKIPEKDRASRQSFSLSFSFSNSLVVRVLIDINLVGLLGEVQTEEEPEQRFNYSHSFEHYKRLRESLNMEAAEAKAQYAKSALKFRGLRLQAEK